MRDGTMTRSGPRHAAGESPSTSRVPSHFPLHPARLPSPVEDCDHCETRASQLLDPRLRSATMWGAVGVRAGNESPA